MRDINPFDYWESHASAIGGLGGRDRSPDPRYCFHTRYHEVRPGRARFILRLEGVRASFGELSVRVHAWKPQGDSHVSLVSGGRLQFPAENDADLMLPAQFVSQNDVRYAFYGYFSEDADVTVDALLVTLEESEDVADSALEPPRSVLATRQKAEEMRPANALLHDGRLTTEYPVSQSCTVEQVSALGLSTISLGGKNMLEQDRVFAQWSEAVCINALDAYGPVNAGFEGLVVGAVSADFVRLLDGAVSISCVQPAALRHMSGDFYDFLLMPDGLEASILIGSGALERWDAIKDWLARLKIGGLAVLGLRYRADSRVMAGSAGADGQILSRNEIGQWALRLIGSGYSVAPMAFAPRSELLVDGRGLAAFILIVQRL